MPTQLVESPPAATNLQVIGDFHRIIVKWTAPTDPNNSAIVDESIDHFVVELATANTFGAAIEQRQVKSADAVLSGTASMYAVHFDVTDTATHYVRIKSYAADGTSVATSSTGSAAANNAVIGGSLDIPGIGSSGVHVDSLGNIALAGTSATDVNSLLLATPSTLALKTASSGTYIEINSSSANTLLLHSAGVSVTGGIYTTSKQVHMFPASDAGDVYGALDATAGPSYGFASLLGGIILGTEMSPSTLTVDQDNYSPAGLGAKALLALVTNAANINITGIDNDRSIGRHLYIINSSASGHTITLVAESSSSLAANRFGMASNIVLDPGEIAEFRYNDWGVGGQRWRLVGTRRPPVGPAGGVLTGTYPNPGLGIGTARGDILTWNSTPVASRLAVGASGTFLRSDGTDPSWQALVASDIPSLGTGKITSGVFVAGRLPGGFNGFANPSALVGLAAVNGSAVTAMRSDGAPAIDQAIVPTWTGTHTWQSLMTIQRATTVLFQGTTYSTTGSSGPQLTLRRSKGASIGTDTVVVSGDKLADIVAQGYDGAAYTNSVDIRAFVDGAVSSGVVPGRVAIFTSDVVGALNEVFRWDAAQNSVQGPAGLGTTATDGFLYIESMAGAPSGTPTAYSNRVPMVYDRTNNKLYVYNGAWKSVTLT